MKRKIILVIGMAILSITQIAAYHFAVDGIYYTILSNSTDVEVSCFSTTSNKYYGNINIPNVVEYNGQKYSVIGIGSQAFYGCSGLTSVTIPNSIIAIGERAFSECSSLTSVTIPNNVTTIDSHAFYGCRSLISVNIPNSITTIGQGAFSGCSSLTSVTIPNNVTTIGSNIFFGCTSLPVIDGLRYADTYLVEVMDNTMTSYTIKSGTKYIGNNSFLNRNNMIAVTIPNSVTYIGQDAFSGCSNLEKVSITDLPAWCNIEFSNNAANPLYYAQHLYLNDKEITNLVIPNDVTSIGNYTFINSAITALTIPNSVTAIGSSAFLGCGNLSSVTWNMKNLVKVQDIFTNAKIENLTIGDDVETIPDNFCKSMSSLKYLVLGTNIKSIGSNAFYGCSGLTSLDIPNSVVSIGSYAFSGCSGLTSLDSPNSVTSIGSRAFYGCNGLTKVNISDISKWCSIDFADVYANPLSFAHHIYLNGKEVTDLQISNEVKTIRNFAFYGCSGLTSVDIPNSVTSIESNAFQDCTGLTTVKLNMSNLVKIQDIFGNAKIQTIIIGDAVETIPDNFCKSMSNLTEFILGKKVNTIGSSALYGCSGLTSITIPNSVTSIGSQAFYGCNGLTKVNISDISKWCNIDFADIHANPLSFAHHIYLNGKEVTDLQISNDVKTIKNFAFYGCSGLTSVDIPNYVTAIGSNAFQNCTDLTKVSISDLSKWCRIQFENNTSNPIYYAKHLYLNNNEIIDLVIPNSVTSIKANTFINSSITSVKMHNNIENIEKWAFYGCENLSEISIPNSVKKIGDQAFSGCRKMKTIDMGTGVENIGSGAFAYCPYIKDITIKAEYPPVCTYNTFHGCGTEDASGKETFTNINLYVMKSSMSMYQKTSVWKDFNIRPIAAQSTYTDKVTVTPYTNSADISWPAIDDADTYNLTISNNGTMVCQHQFNESGQLMSVVYRMPSATNDAQLTEALGFQYTITDLASGTKYDFNLLIQDKTQKTIKTYTGTFITEGATALEYVHFDGNISDLISQPSTMIFNLQGQNVSNQRDNLAQGTYIVHNDGKAYKILINH